MKPVILHPEAEAEFEESADFIEARRAGYGEAFRQEIAEAIAQIGSTPTVFAEYKGGSTRRRLVNEFGYSV
jgi:plasmid stabilization system protein ParE